MYCRAVGRIVAKHGLKYHCYADDSQLYLIVKSRSEWPHASGVIESCVDDIYRWMESNMLKLNEGKTEVIELSPRSAHIQTTDLCLKIGKTSIKPTPVVKNLGSWWDEHLTMERQVNTVVKTCYHQLRVISRISPFLSKDACRTLVQAFVTSRLDYGNAILSGISKASLSKLKKVQHFAARLVVRKPLQIHITPVLKDLHWLPVERRIQFKVLLYVFKGLNGLAPKYITDLLDVPVPSRTLRSGKLNLLVIPKTRTVFYGNRLFPWIAPTMWNKLPEDVKSAPSLDSFKSRLKTHLFGLTFK